MNEREPAELPSLDGAWLVVIDAQRIFADPASPWAAPRFAETIEPVRRLAAACEDRVVFTRWVPDQDPRGSWVPYFATWPFARRRADDPLLDLVDDVAGLAEAARVVSAPTFGKWVPELIGVTGEHPTIVLTGVATDCCVVATALPAADAGATVLVAADGCAGSDDAHHRLALDQMALFPPQITVTTSTELLDRARP